MALDPEDDTPSGAWERLKHEPELFQQMVELSRTDDIDTLLLSALEYAARRVGAAEGFVALYDQGSGADSVPRWCAVVGRDAERAEWPQLIREVFSRGVTRQALQLWRSIDVVSTQSRTPDSMVGKKIHNVLATPVGRQVRGVLVLQNVSEAAAEDATFRKESVLFAETFASLLGPFVDRAVLIAQSGDMNALGIVGRGRTMVEVRHNVRTVAMRDDVAALVVGPQGSGRTHVVRAIHANSPRRARPLIREHCSAWSAAEANDLLFGAEGATRQPGLLASVDGGTLLLEDIDTLPTATQSALVRFLETGAYRPRGATADRRASVRILATATTDADKPLDMPKLRRDLFIRLNRGLIRLPALRHRREDITDLLEQLGRAAAARHHLSWPGVDAAAAQEATLKRWPGDVAQLASSIDIALRRTEGKRPIDAVALFGPPPEAPRVPIIDDWLHPDIPMMTWGDAKDGLLRAYLLRALIAHDLFRNETARALAITSGQLYANINRFELRGVLEQLDRERAARLGLSKGPEQDRPRQYAAE